jgi:hypothetical protein
MSISLSYTDGRLVDQVAELRFAAMSKLLKYELGQRTVRTKLCSVVDELQESVLAFLTDKRYVLYVNYQCASFEFGFQTSTDCP